MAITIPIVTEFADKGLKSAEAGFNNFKMKVSEAEGGVNKMKAGFGAATDFMKANAATFAASAGAALVGLAVKGIGAFQDLALGASKFADATGLAVEDASRWTEVAGDMGVEANSVQGAIVKMSRAIYDGSDAFQSLGAEIEYTKDGTVDVNKTFLNTIQALKNVKDPTERAALATKVLGKSWTDLAELINVGSDELTKSLNQVSDAKVINPEEVERAKRLREAQDALGDSLEELSITLGQKLVPALAETANALSKVIDFSVNTDTAVKTGNVFLDAGAKLWSLFADNTDDAATSLNKVDSALGDSRAALRAAGFEAARTARGIRGLDEDTNGLIDTWDKLLGRLNETSAFNNVKDSLDRVYEAAGRALEEKTPAAARAAQDAVSNLYGEVADYIQLLGDIPAEKQTTILAALDRGDYESVLRMLDELTRERTVRITVSGGTSVRPGDTPTESRGGRGVTVVAPDGTTHYLPPGIDFGALAGRSSTRSVDLTSGGGGSGNRPTVMVNVQGSVTTERDLVETIRRGLVNAQRNGAQLVYSNT
jgi:TP901 family phage tail tape measure protein